MSTELFTEHPILFKWRRWNSVRLQPDRKSRTQLKIHIGLRHYVSVETWKLSFRVRYLFSLQTDIIRVSANRL